MNKFKRLFLLLIFLLLASAAATAADNPLKPFTANYIVLHDNDTFAHTTISLARIGDDRWRYVSQSIATGWLATMLGIAVDQESEWTWADGLKILSYQYHRSGKEKRVHLKFDWQQKKVTNIINGDPWQMQIPDGAQDKLSINLALMAHLAHSKSDVSFPVADGGRLKTYDFKFLGEETIDTKLGQLQTVKVLRNKRGRKNRQAIIWLAPTLGYLPVRMEKSEKDGQVVTMVIESLN